MTEYYYGFDLDCDFEDMWHELEKIQDGRAGHRIAIKSTGKREAAAIISNRLTDFFYNRMYLSDEYGCSLEVHDTKRNLRSMR